MIVSKLPIRSIEDERGKLGVVEFECDLPFEVKRVYYLTDLGKSEPRGFHAHKELYQVAMCITGSCKMLLDTGFDKQWVHMNSKDSEGILIQPMVWHEMHDFSDDCVFLVYASDVYRESDYIRSYSDFLSNLSEEKN